MNENKDTIDESELKGPRPCEDIDLGSTLDLVNLVLRLLNSAPGSSPKWPSIGYDWAHIYNSKNLENIRIISHNGRVVSSVAIYPSLLKTSLGTVSLGGINGFVTDPNYRRRGLGEKVLLDAHEKMKQNGHHLALLVTGIFDYYRKYGWENAGSVLNFSLDRSNINYLPSETSITIKQNWRDYLPQLFKLFNQEPLRSLRNKDHFNFLLERKLEKIFVGVVNNIPVSYVGTVGTEIKEYAGKEIYVASLLKDIFIGLDNKDKTSETTWVKSLGTSYGSTTSYLNMNLLTPDISSGLPKLLQTLRFPFTRQYLGVFKIIDPVGLFHALGLNDVKVTKVGSNWNLRKDNEERIFSEVDLLKFILGPEKKDDTFLQDIFPLKVFQSSPDIV